MKRKRILLLGIHRLRDLPGLAAIKAHLEVRYGYDVMLTTRGSLGILVPTFRPHLVVFPELWTAEEVARATGLKPLGI
ncbi:MAG: hypothetical protein ACE5JO_06245, partial [Candidatus Binatia bacterium]